MEDDRRRTGVPSGRQFSDSAGVGGRDDWDIRFVNNDSDRIG